MAAPTNIVYKGKSNVVQFNHYPTMVSGVSDFDRASNATAVGNFLNGAVNDGDFTTYDYVDLRKSVTKKYANKIEIYMESLGECELFIRFNPMFEYQSPRLAAARDIPYLGEPYNKGWDDFDDIIRLYVPANSSKTFIYEGCFTGFNIDYNGSTMSASDLTALTITCS